MSRKCCGNDEKDEDIDEIIKSVVEITTTSTAVSAAPAVVDAFMHTPEFRRHFVEFVHDSTLTTLRFVTKAWKVVADAFIDEGVECGAMMVIDGKNKEYAGSAKKKRRELVTRALFPLNIMKVGEWACEYSVNLIVLISRRAL